MGILNFKSLLTAISLVTYINLNATDITLSDTAGKKSDVAVKDYWYFSAGSELTTPEVSIGYRFQRNKSGLNTYFTHKISEKFLINSFGIDYLFYPSENVNNQIYMGAGSDITHFYLNDYYSLENCFNFLLGYEFKIKEKYNFIECKMGMPVFTELKFTRLYPNLSLQYGVAF